MPFALSQLANSSSDAPFSVRGSQCHRKRSSSLYALDDLSLPSPPLSPSVSINFSGGTSVTGEIPIIFEFLTTSSMPSEERISKMASLKPELPPLAKFSPMSAFFPMSDSSGTLNTISTEAFGTRRRASCYSDASQRRCSVLSDGSAVYSPLSADFGLPSPTEVISHQGHSDSENVMPTSVSMPSVRVQDYDVGQKKLGDISNFTISAYLDSPSATSLGSLKAGIRPEEAENLPILPQGLLSAPTTPDIDDKTPTQSTFLKRPPNDQHQPSSKHSVLGSSTGVNHTDPVITDLPQEPSSTSGNTSLSVPSSDYDDETPTQATFQKHQHHSTTDKGIVSISPETTHTLPVTLQIIPNSPDSDDKTPTQATFAQRQPPSPTKCNAARGKSNEKLLPPEPIEDEASDAKSVGPATNDTTMSPEPIPGNPLPVPCLKHAQWLRDTIVELWIDQEGFRAIRPRFFLASVSNGLPYSQDPSYAPPAPGTVELTEEHDPLFTTVAEFLPVSRAAHYFHHAAFDRAPTLHRITTGDESKDYISRAATIGLREDGVFFVHGTEDHRLDGDRPLSFISTGSSSSYSHPYSATNANPPPGGRIVRLNWRFEYFVSSRRPDGRSAQRGEKLITPLSFSCTPALLDRTRANKVTVLHIMKKTLLPKLIAQKLEPPDLPVLEGTPRTRASMSGTSLASLISANEEHGHGHSRNMNVPTAKSAHTHNRGRSGSTSTSISEQGVLPQSQVSSVPATAAVPAKKSSATTSTTAAKLPFNPPRLKTPPRPPLPYTKHRRGSHSDTTPEDYIRQRQRDASGGSGGANVSAHERSRSVCSSFVRGRGSAPQLQSQKQHQQHPSTTFKNHSSHAVGRGTARSAGRGGRGAFSGGIFGPIIPQEELMKMLGNSESATASANNAAARRPHSIRVEVVDNVPVTTLPAAPRHKQHS